MPFFNLPSGASPILAGPTAPTGGVGQVGDLFLVKGPTGAGLLYGPKDAVSGWQDPIDFAFAPTGNTGPTGASITGPTGAASFVTGPTAPASTLSVGSVSTGTAAVHITGVAPSQSVHFTLPFVTGPTGASGSVGATGAPAVLSIGTVATGAAAVSITGTAPNYTLSFTLPFVTGPTGAASTVTGPAGAPSTVPGPTGAPSTVTGPTGAVGAGIAIIGSVTGVGDLPTGYAGDVGDSYIVQTSGNLYAWDGSTWNDVGNIVGPTGPSGSVGATGAASTVPGPTGPTASASTLTIGGVTTGAAGAHITGTAPDQQLHLVLPPGPTGAASTVTGPTGPAGASAIGLVLALS